MRQRELQGAACFRNVRYDGRFTSVTPEMQWPQRMPAKGVLELEFVSCVRVGSNVKRIQDELLGAVWYRLDHESVDDAWRVSFIRTLCAVSYFSCAQANTVLASFSYGGEFVTPVDFLATLLLNSLLNCKEPVETRLRPLVSCFAGLLKRQAGVLLFGRLMDPENLDVMLKGMREEQRNELMNALGLLGTFHPRNPTGGRHSQHAGSNERPRSVT